MHFIYLGDATWAAHTIPIWGPLGETVCAHTPWAYTQWAGNNNSTRATLWLCLLVTQIPSACIPLWLIDLTHSLWPYKQGFSQHCPSASALQLWHTWCLLLQLLLLLLLVWMVSDFEELTWTQWDGTQWFSMTRREFGTEVLSLTLDKGRLCCLEQNSSATYHLDLLL